MRFPILLAKSAPPDSRQSHHTLRGHTAMVVAAAHQLLDARGLASLKAVGLPESAFDRLRRIVLVGAYAHDLGKCSLHFQLMVRGEPQVQLVRHEAASLWLAWPGRPLGAWLAEAAGGEEDLMLALCAAAGHHRKFWGRAIAPDSDRADMPLLVDHPDFRRLLELAAAMTKLSFGPPPVLEPCSIQAAEPRPRVALADWEEECRNVVQEEAALLAIAKALVLDADVAGSAIPKSSESLAWIKDALERRASREDLARIVEGRLKGNPLRPFQKSVAAASSPLTLVVAGCGSGKTAAAYQWAAEQHAGKQLWMTYPTTGTTTEGYRDYAADPQLELDARLEHSRAEVDLEILSPVPEGKEDIQRDQDRLDALRSWQAKVVTSTVDTVLGIVQNHRKGLYAWAGLSNAAVVFDEVHSYDDGLFGALLRFLEEVPGVPALIMTASLPASRRAALEKVSITTHGRSLEVVAGPADLESIKRYLRFQSADPWPDVEACLKQGGKVLWVSNTVDRCRAIVEAASKRGLSAKAYHSRFRYEDRVMRHGDVIEAFRQPGGVLAVTTQVAEMSLDLSADLLVTDRAPIPALIQRLGRLNRRATPNEPGLPKPFIVLSPECPLPYKEAELQQTERWLDALGDGPLSQGELTAAWKDDESELAFVPSAWFDGGFTTEPAELREASIGIQVLLEGDAREVGAGKLAAVAAALPMLPPKQDWLKWKRLHGYVVAPAGTIEYDQYLGARWR